MGHLIAVSSFVVAVVIVLQPGKGPVPAAEKAPQQTPQPPVLTGDDAKRVEELGGKVDDLRTAGKYAEAQEPAREILAIRTRGLGAGHWQTADAKRDLQTLERLAALPAEARAEFTAAEKLSAELAGLRRQGKYREGLPVAERMAEIRRRHLGEEHHEVASAIQIQATFAEYAGKYEEAQALYGRVIQIREKVLGKDHPHTAAAYTNLAGALHARGQFARAGDLFSLAYASYGRSLGEDHRDTATACNNLAVNLAAQGKYGEAARLGRQALEVRRRLLGENHEDTAQSYNNLARNFLGQGKYAEAEPLFRQALAIFRGLLDEGHPTTLVVYNNVAFTLDAQGKQAEAELLYRRTLDAHRDALGDNHPRTLLVASNLAYNLHSQRKFAEAETLGRKTLDARRGVLDKRHPDIGNSCNNLALTLEAQGRYADAEPFCRESLAIFEGVNRSLPRAVVCRNTLALNLAAQGKQAEAEALLREAVELSRSVLGEGHPDTVASRINLASRLMARGEYAAAEGLLAAVTEHFEAARRQVGFTGLERVSFAAKNSPWPLLAAAAAHNGKPRDAWKALENYLARGLLDELTAWPLDPDELRRERDLRGRLSRLDGQIAGLLGAKEMPDAARQKADELRKQYEEAQAEFARFHAGLAARYGAAAGEVYDLARVQAQLPADTALVAWVDVPGRSRNGDEPGQHWACVVRNSGPPEWAQLPGGVPKKAWTAEDDGLAPQARSLFANRPASPDGQWKEIGGRLRARRLAPVEKYLQASDGSPAVRNLIVLPSAWMAGIPVEILTDRYTVSYAPSATMFAWLREKRTTAEREQTHPRRGGLLAVGDPVFAAAGVAATPPAAPDHGVFVTAVPSGSNAARGGIHSGDVLLAYAGTKLDSPDALGTATRSAISRPGEKGGGADIPVRVWREGKTLDLAIPGGPLGARVSREGPAESLRMWRALSALTRGSRGETFAPLPGTRREVQAIARLFREKEVLLGSEASEQQLDRLRSAGRLKEFRFVHFATHGVPDDRSAMRSALILSQDKLPDPLGQVLAGQEVYDGRLTAERMLRDWNLDADLVTLSACQTGLGKYSGGEGYLGFSQALFRAGARGLVVTLWQVDDRATALLMTRFYENLLGTPDGGAAPRPKAAALAEAKAWLKALSAEDVARLTADLPKGLPNGTRGVRRERDNLNAADAPRPFAHPYYWSAFILIGDPR